MRYAIVINMDYSSHPDQECKSIWILIRERMSNAGFRLEGRLFTAEMSAEDACEASRNVMEEINKDSRFEGGDDVYNYINEFYCYDHTHTVNLLLPPTESIRLE